MIKIMVIVTFILFFIGYSYGSVTKFLKDSSIRDFENGKFENMNLNKSGFVSLSPSIRELFSKEDIMFIWDVVEDNKGNLFFSTGNRPRIYRYSSRGKLKLFYEAKNATSIVSLAIDSKGNIYAAAIPDSIIIKISSSGSVKVLAKINEGYIWKLKLGSSGQLYVATGNPARVYKVSDSGKKTILYSSKEESHFLAMDIDSKENIYFASADKGILYKYHKDSKEVSVLYDSYEDEIRSIIVDKKDNIYFATATKLKKHPPNTFDYTDTFILYGSYTAKRIRTSKKAPLKNSIYKVSSKGDIKKVFTKDNTIFLSLAIDSNGWLYAGSGDKGIIYLIKGVNDVSIFVDTDELQITSLWFNKANRLIVGTGNIGKVFELDLQSPFTGTYYSRIFRTRGNSTWGNISWHTNFSDKVYIHTRTGKTITPDKTWSTWSTSYMDSNGELIRSPQGSYIQYKAVMFSKSGNKLPVLKKVVMSYLLNNRAPIIENIKLRQDINKSLPSTKLLNSKIPPSVYTISWTAFDQDNDLMVYSIYFRNKINKNWILIKKDIIKKQYSFDSRRLPDGEFLIRVVASDKWSNGEEREKVGEKVSEVFTIDNTPPSITEVRVNTIDNIYIIGGIARDNSSFIKAIEYSINGSNWRYLNPKDMIYDSLKEDFQVVIDPLVNNGLVEGENIIIFRVADLLGNFSSKQVSFTVGSKS